MLSYYFAHERRKYTCYIDNYVNIAKQKTKILLLGNSFFQKNQGEYSVSWSSIKAVGE